MQTVFKNLKAIEEVVSYLLPPKANNYIGDFKLEFLLSSIEWKEELLTLAPLSYVRMQGERNITYYISKASVDQELEYLMSILDPYYEMSDDNEVYKRGKRIEERIDKLKKL